MDGSLLSFKSMFYHLVLLACLTQLVDGQEVIGVDICACQPRVIQFQLDLSLTCQSNNIVVDDAVDDITCLVSPFEDAVVTDLVPVAVRSISILERNQFNAAIPMKEVIYKGNFRDGDTLMYSSIVTHPGPITN